MISSTNISKLRVVVADDSAMICQQLSSSVEPLSYAEIIESVGTAGAAVESVIRLKPDVVILDIEMPGSGISALKKIKSAEPATKVLILTNHAGKYYEQKCRRIGADYFLDKSLQFDDVPGILALIAAV